MRSKQFDKIYVARMPNRNSTRQRRVSNSTTLSVTSSQRHPTVIMVSHVENRDVGRITSASLLAGRSGFGYAGRDPLPGLVRAFRIGSSRPGLSDSRRIATYSTLSAKTIATADPDRDRSARLGVPELASNPNSPDSAPQTPGCVSVQHQHRLLKSHF